MNITFRKNLKHSYMVIEKIPAFSENDFAVQMLLQNDIRTLLKFRHETVNGKTNLLYDISSRQVFQRQYEINKMTEENLKALCYSIRTMVNSLEEYLLDPNNIILKKECIFTDPEGKKYEFCYHPYYHGDIIVEFRELFHHILQIIDYEDERTVRLAYEIHGKLQSDNYTLADIMEVLNGNFTIQVPKIEKIEPEKIDVLEEMEKQPSESELEKPFFERIADYLRGRNLIDVLEDINNKELRKKIGGYTAINYKENRASSHSYDNDTRIYTNGINPPGYKQSAAISGEAIGQRIMEEGVYSHRPRLPVKGTILLEDPESGRRKLIGQNNKEKQEFNVDHYPFTIGKLSGYVNAEIKDPAISRLHARIYAETESGTYQIEDLNSTNGTFVNGRRLQPYTKAPLQVGDVIALAGEEFEFR